MLDPQGIELPDLFVPGAPLYLIEAHMRTAFVRALCRTHQARGPHMVWVGML